MSRDGNDEDAGVGNIFRTDIWKIRRQVVRQIDKETDSRQMDKQMQRQIDSRNEKNISI